MCLQDPYERATWLDTRDEEDNFKALVLLTLAEVEHEFILIPAHQHDVACSRNEKHVIVNFSFNNIGGSRGRARRTLPPNVQDSFVLTYKIFET